MIDKTDKSHLRVYDYEYKRHFHQIFSMAVACIPLKCDVLKNAWLYRRLAELCLSKVSFCLSSAYHTLSAACPMCDCCSLL
jgi:hypothetical protein